MTEAVKAMNDLGFIDTTDKHDDTIVRQFTKLNHLGYIADVINFMCGARDSIDVFANNLINRCGSRLDHDLLKAISLNIVELERELEK